MTTSRPKRLMGLLLVLALIVAACGGDTGEDNTTTSDVGADTTEDTGDGETGTTQASTDPVTIRFLTHQGLTPVWAEWFEWNKAAYEEENPNVTIDYEFIGEDDAFQQLRAAYQAGGEEAPDIHVTDLRPFQAIPWEQSGWLLNLEEHGLDKSRWDPALLNASSYGGGTWAIPTTAFALLIWYDKNLVENQWGFEIPDDGVVSWDQFEEMANRALDEGIYPLANGIQDFPPGAAYWPAGLALNHAGVDVASQVFHSGELPYTNEAVQDGLAIALETIPDWFNPNVLSLGRNESAELVYSGDAAFQAMGSWFPAVVQGAIDEGTTVEGFELGVMRYPTTPGAESPGAIEWGPSGGMAVSAFTEHPDVAVDYLNFMARPESGTEFMELTKSTTSIAGATVPDDAPEYLQKIYDWVQQGPTFGPPVYYTPSGDVEQAWTEGFARFYADPSYELDTFLEELQQLREEQE